jgi:hypothetical protein
MDEQEELERAKAMSILEAMKGPAFETQWEIYLAHLRRLPSQHVYKAVSNLSNATWRPSPEEIVAEAAKLEMRRAAGTPFPFPSADEAYAEIMHKVKRYGLNAKILYSDRPNIRVAGAPPFSHPLVAQAVAMVGGWEALCSGEANYSEGLSKQIKTLYERQAERFIFKAAELITKLDTLPASEYPRYFPKWRPFEIVTTWDGGAEDQRRISDYRPDPCPAEIKTKLRLVGVEVGEPTEGGLLVKKFGKSDTFKRIGD